MEDAADTQDVSTGGGGGIAAFTICVLVVDAESP